MQSSEIENQDNQNEQCALNSFEKNMSSGS